MKIKIIPIFFIIALSVLLIFFKFNQIPKNLSFDEIEFGQLALSLDNRPYTPYSPIAFGHSTLYFYLILLSMKIFDVSNFALRFPSAFFGIVAIVMFYKVMTQVLSQKNKFLYFFIPLTASLLLITSRWFLNFARFSFEATFLIFLELVSIYFLFRKKFIFSGIFAGLSFLSYTPGRIFFLLPLISIIIWERKNLLKNLLQFIVPVLFITAPLLFYLFSHPDLRINELLVSDSTSVLENIKRIFLMFFTAGDMNGRHNFPGKPGLNPLLGLIFILGSILAIKDIRKPMNQFFIGYFLISIIPSIFTVTKDNPNMLRTVSVLPSIFYFSVLPLIKITELNNKFKIYFLIIFLILLTASSFYELRTYFQFQSRVMKNSFEVKCQIQDVVKYKISSIPKNCRVNENEF